MPTFFPSFSPASSSSHSFISLMPFSFLSSIDVCIPVNYLHLGIKVEVIKYTRQKVKRSKQKSTKVNKSQQESTRVNKSQQESTRVTRSLQMVENRRRMAKGSEVNNSQRCATGVIKIQTSKRMITSTKLNRIYDNQRNGVSTRALRKSTGVNQGQQKSIASTSGHEG